MKNTPNIMLNTILYANSLQRYAKIRLITKVAPCYYKKYIIFVNQKKFYQSQPYFNKCQSMKQIIKDYILQGQYDKKIKSIKLSKKIYQPQPSTPQLSQQQTKLPLKPFSRKFTKSKTQTNQCSYIQESSNVAQNVARIVTQAQTNQYYQSDFQYQYQSQVGNQSEVEQKQNPQHIIGQSQQISQSCQKNEFIHTLGISQLLHINQKLIQSIQFLRQNLNLYKLNVLRLNEQKHELTYLRNQTFRAQDYHYEQNLDRKNNQSCQKQKIAHSNNKRASLLLKKHKYQRVRQAQRKAYPNEFQIQKQDLIQNKVFEKLLIMKQQLYIKKKQYYQYEHRKNILDQKIKQYHKIIQSQDLYLNREDKQSLQVMKMQLQEQINHKKTIFNISEIEINSEITSINHQIVSVEAKIMKMSNQMKQMRQKTPQQKQKKEYQIPKTTLKRSKYGQYTPSTPKQIKQYFYNRQNRRNSYIKS